jgi:hypothetical protein
MRRTWGVVALALAACTPRSKSKPPETPVIEPTPVLTPTPWWTGGEGACPSTEAPPAPGGPPGSGFRPGVLNGGPPPQGRVWCTSGGVEHGPSTRFHPSGNPAEAGVFDRGERIGAWTTWHANGPMASHGHYAEARMTGVWATWWPTGAPRDRGEYVVNQKRGMWLHWDEDAQPGDSPARFIEYDDKGDERARGVFRDGQPVEMLPVCLIGESYPGCRIVPILDITVRTAVERPAPRTGQDDESGVFEVGMILNVSDRHGLGASIGLLGGDDYAGKVVRARYRFWLHRYIALEATIGQLYGHDDTPVTVDDRGTVAGLTLLGGDILGVIVEVQDDGGERSTHVGVRVGLPTVLIAAYIAAHVGGH